MTGTASPATGADTATSQTHLCPVDLLGTGLELHTTPLDASITLDESWAPYVQTDLTVAMPDSATLAVIDPRADQSLSVSPGYAGYVAEQSYGLWLREATPDWRGGTVRLVGQSAECLAQDVSLLTTIGTYSATSNVVDVVDDILDTTVPGFSPVLSGFPAGTLGAAMDVAAGSDVWDVVTDLVDRVGGWVYAAAQQAFVFTTRPTTTGTPVLELFTGDGGTVTDMDETTSREGDWASRVLVESTWTDAGGTEHVVRGWAAVSGITLHKTLKVDRDQPTTQAKNATAATAILRRAWARGRSMTIEAVAAYWLKPMDTVRVTRPNGVVTDELVSRITFRPTQGTMTVVTRAPDPTLTITTGGSGS